ncbi:hypothetical protein JQ633_03790 [Bradyrhizobium tropiciagri]|uniref:hypothetical protein n=1 Tax=Bradyrhizobium tropiciagri TaxID=312253 RepID=UPI001BA54616|nr:hypothetical protein [Bradyrhizobium tropiciagri]MBR0869467.1 hypothetical protein [Bradyrhizobium tropiciagri]
MANASGDDALLRKLRRLTARAGSVKANDRAQLTALLDDITTLRGELLRECARLDAEINRATVRATAISAYGRGAQSIRALRRGH